MRNLDENSQAVFILAAKDISQNRRVPLLAKFFVSLGYKVTVYAYTPPHPSLLDDRVDFQPVPISSLRARLLEWIESTEGKPKNIWRPRFKGSKIAGIIIGCAEIVKFTLRKPISKVVHRLYRQQSLPDSDGYDFRYAHILRRQFGYKIAAKRRSKFHKAVYISLNSRVENDSIILCHDRFSAPMALKFARRGFSIFFDVVELFRNRSRVSLEMESPEQLREIEAAETLMGMSKLLTVGECLARELGAADKMTVFYNGRPLSHWRGQSGFNLDRKVIAFSGSFFPGCGLKALLKLISLLPPEYTLRLVGSFNSSEYTQEILDILTQMSLHNRVKILENVDVENVPQSLLGAGLYVIPFLSEKPNLRVSMPNRFFDALAAGLPIVSQQGLCVTDWALSNGIGQAIDMQDLQRASKIILEHFENSDMVQLTRNLRAVFEESSYENQIQKLGQQVKQMGMVQ